MEKYFPKYMKSSKYLKFDYIKHNDYKINYRDEKTKLERSTYTKIALHV